VKNTLMLGTAAAALALLAGCGSSKGTNSSSTRAAAATAGSGYARAATTKSTTSSASPAVLVTSKQGKLGKILAAGPKKMTVYLFEADKGSTSACSGACASVWPPVTSAGAVTAAAGASAADLGTITRSDGTRQVTYKGHPLYYFVKDKDDGDAYGQGVKAFGASWYVLSPSGAKVDNS
jgi:predicted lipoprotein with Yx(FWY)xxD motif